MTESVEQLAKKVRSVIAVVPEDVTWEKEQAALTALDALEAELVRYREALQQIANPSPNTWRSDSGPAKFARAALAEPTGEPE